MERAKRVESIVAIASGAALVVLCALWILFHMLELGSASAAELLWPVLFIGTPLAVASTLGGVAARVVDRRLGPLLAGGAYVAIGVMYAFSRAGQFDGNVIEALVWPSLMAWQDACAWLRAPCPSG